MECLQDLDGNRPHGSFRNFKKVKNFCAGQSGRGCRQTPKMAPNISIPWCARPVQSCSLSVSGPDLIRWALSKRIKRLETEVREIPSCSRCSSVCLEEANSYARRKMAGKWKTAFSSWRGSWPMASKKVGSSLLQLQRTKVCQQPRELEDGKLQKGTRPGWHLDFSLVRPQKVSPSKLGLDSRPAGTGFSFKPLYLR